MGKQDSPIVNSTKISVVNVNKKYNGQIVLEDISFDIKEGEFVSILGSSGCGKTTLLKILIGIEKPDTGEILKDGEGITNNQPSKRGMGLVFQNYALFPNMSVWGNVAYALRGLKVSRPVLDKNKEQVLLIDKESIKQKKIEIKKAKKEIKDAKELQEKVESLKQEIDRITKNPSVPAFKMQHLPKEEIKQRVNDVLATVGLSDFANKRPSKMSGGQQQRVAIARTLALNPDIILFDEPMAALDADIRMSLRKEIKELQKKLNKTMIYVTHDQEEAFSMSDRIIVMSDSHIVQYDTPNNIYKHPANEFVKKFVVNHLDEKAEAILKSTK